ncbi:ATP-dependent DNA helicase PIF1, partial [Brachionus plicatilis]
MTRPKSEKIVVITNPKTRYNPLDKQNHNKFCYYQLIKYSSWDNSQLKQISNFDDAVERFETFIKEAPENVIYSLNFFNDFLKELKRIREESDPEPDHELIVTEFTELAELVPIKEIIDSFPVVDLSYDWIQRRASYSKEELLLMIDWVDKQSSIHLETEDNKCPYVEKDQLNEMQRFAYEIIYLHLTESKQLLMILIGTAGTGKSFTIFAISGLLSSILKRCAPTAKAAFIIRGETIHSMFSIPVQSEFCKLKPERLSMLQQEFKDTKYIIIDEYSMLSQKMLAMIDQRLREIKG